MGVQGSALFGLLCENKVGEPKQTFYVGVLPLFSQGVKVTQSVRKNMYLGKKRFRFIFTSAIW